MRALILFIMLSAPFGTYSEGLLGEITPKGWIRQYLERQCTGLSGHPLRLTVFPQLSGKVKNEGLL